MAAGKGLALLFGDPKKKPGEEPEYDDDMDMGAEGMEGEIAECCDDDVRACCDDMFDALKADDKQGFCDACCEMCTKLLTNFAKLDKKMDEEQ